MPIQNTGEDSTTSSTPATIPRDTRPRANSATASASTTAITRASDVNCTVAPSCRPITSVTGSRS